jgi:hypothetical protein
MKQTEKRVCKNCGPTDFQLGSRGYWTCVACLKAAKKKYAESDPERARRQKDEWYERNRTDILANLKKEREEDPEVVKERRAKHYVSRQDHIKKRVKTYKDAAKLEVMSHYSGGPPKCRTCAISDVSKLALDHTNDDGKAHRKEIGVGNGVYLWVRKNGFPPIFQVLCHNCNFLKYVKDIGSKDSKWISYCLKLKSEVFSIYSGGRNCCLDCGEKDIRVLTIDHIDGHGNEHRRASKVGTGIPFYRMLKKNGFPSGFQVLCFNCNLAKGARTL